MATTYLSKTFAQAGNRRTFTISYWIKMGQVSTGADQAIMGAAQDGSNSDDLYIHTGRLNFSGYYGSTAYIVRTTAKYRDLSGWYHHVIRFDTTQSTASDRVRLYVNGELQTALDENTYPSQNLETTYFNTARLHTIGSIAHSAPNLAFNGSMSHFHFCDGYSYGADSFGETDSTTGIWKPKTAPSVTYGNNGFFLKFENSGAMGTDSSGNSNNFTVNGTMTQLIDTPSNVFATMNPLNKEIGGSTLSLGNTKLVTTAQGGGPYTGRTIATLGASSGKYYWEVKPTTTVSSTYPVCSVVGEDFRLDGNTYLSGGSGSQSYITYKFENGGIATNFTGSRVDTSYGSAVSANDIVGVALDLDNGKIFFSINGTWQNSGDPVNGTNPASSSVGSLGGDFVFPAFGDENYSSSATLEVNFGNGYFGTTAVSSAQNPDDGIGIFEYDVPAGYRALCTKSINAQEYS